MSKRVKAFSLVVALVGVGLGTWAVVSSGNAPPAAPAPAKPQPVLSVSVVAAPNKTVDDEIRVIGTVVPRENVMVMSELPGLRVRAVYVETGDYVRKGQPLALLDGESLSIDTQSLRAEFERTRDEYDRIKDMLAMGIVSKEFGRQRQAAFEVARAKLSAAQLSVNRTQIVAPTDGLVYERTAAIGGLNSASEPLFRIAKEGKVEMEASVPEALVRRLKPGMPVTVTLAGESAPMAGKVRLITPVVDNTRRSTGVRIGFERDRAAPVGVFAEASITVAQVSGAVVPGTALQQDALGTFVWQVGPENVVARKPVTVAMRTAGSVVVKESLEGPPIVAKAGAFLKDGDVVALVKEQ
jgi:HlyD family secretion protein